VSLLFPGLILVCIVSILLSLSFGQADISLQQTISASWQCITGPGNCITEDVNTRILFDLRLPRTLIALVTGAALALAGVVLQTVTRNPLADPYLFGISAGASLGAVISMVVLSSAVLSLFVGAMVGSIAAVILIIGLAGRHARHIQSLILAGVAVSFLLSSFTSIVLYHASPNVVAAMMFWLMGSFDHIVWEDLFWPAIALLIAGICFYTLRRWMNALLAGDNIAHSLGISVARFRITLISMAAILTAIIVAKVGAIGFVGLMIPHISRHLCGHQLDHLIPTAIMVGGIFMIWADVIARTLLPEQQLPIGIVTAAIGSIFFILLLRQQTNKHEA
jgi:iron complex transport system permease protein